MSQSKTEEIIESPTVLVISDSEDNEDLDNGLAGFTSPPKTIPTNVDQTKESPSARKKIRMDGETNEDTPIDIDSISTNPIRTRTKVSSDTSSKFPVSSPSDAGPAYGNRKKYVKNTLPAGEFERMLNELSQSHPPMTFREKLENWVCCNELSDVEDVNNFDENFQKREIQYSKSSSSRRSATKEPSSPNYNYQHFRSVVLESLKGSPVGSNEVSRKSIQTSCSKEASPSTMISKNFSQSKPDPNKVTLYEKILCPSSESSATKASPSIRLHWTDEESVFRCNRLNPDIDKYSNLIKVRIDYKKQINLKSKIKEIFKTPTIPIKYNSPTKSLEESTEIKSEPQMHLNKIVAERKIETRRSTSGKSTDSRRSSGKQRTERRSSDKFPEVNSFQQDEFCNYLGLGLNGKVYSPTPTDNKRRSLRVKRLQQVTEPEKKKKERSQIKKKNNFTEPPERAIKKDELDVTTNYDEIRCNIASPAAEKAQEREAPVELQESKSPTSDYATNITTKVPEIKIIMQLRNASTPLKVENKSSSLKTENSTPPPTSRRLRRTRATSNGTSTCPRSSQSDEFPTKVILRRRLLHQNSQEHDHTSELSESLLSESQLLDNGSNQHNGSTSTVTSSEDKKEEPEENEADCVHKKYQRYLEESRKTKPSIFIVESIDNSVFKTLDSTTNSNAAMPTEHLPKEKKPQKSQKKKIVLRRLLRRNGTVVGTFNQRILRNRTVAKFSRATEKKHPKTKLLKKKQIRLQLNRNEVDNNTYRQNDNEKPEEVSSDNEQIQAERAILSEAIDGYKAMQIDNEYENVDEVTCDLSQMDPLSSTIPCISPKEMIKSDAEMQTEACAPPLPINFLTTPSSRMPNPLTPENGRVLYAYYELDILTVVQDFMVTFWKTCKLIQVMRNSADEWANLGECKRLLYDTEINSPYKNRICVHNSIPIYMEMRAKELPKLHRDCDLISVYINVYYYHDEELVAKSHSIQLDTVASLPQNVVFTTITDSRYFVMCWSQETLLGKPRSGLCKYSLTPHLDTLASIREFKCMRHEIRYLECTTDDNLIGFGDSQVTLWDHRSGDILMNYDLDTNIGDNFGSIHYPPLDVGHAKTVLIFQKTSAQELCIIAINVSHNAPSHQLISKHVLPSEFQHLKSSMQTDDYIILTNKEHQEVWIDCSDPQYLMQIRYPEGQSRYYSRCKHNVIDIAENHLALETFSNFVLKMINTADK